MVAGFERYENRPIYPDSDALRGMSPELQEFLRNIAFKVRELEDRIKVLEP